MQWANTEKWDEQVFRIGETVAMKKPSKHLIAEVPRSVAKVGMTIGIDLGDVWSHYCTLNEDGEVVDRGRFRTTLSGVGKWFTDVPRARVAMETGTHSIWVSEQLRELGHEVIVANVRELRAISHSNRKSDTVDAEKIARFARVDPEILRPICHRTVAQQEALTLIRARNLIVRLRTAAANSVRGLAKPCGYRLPASSTLCFAKRCMSVLPPGLAQALGPVLEQIAAMTVKIQQYDRTIKRLTETEYPETQALLQVYGVGQLTALTYVLTLGSKERFKRSRDVGCYLGLRPRPANPGTATHNLASPRLVTSTSDLSWSSAPTMSLVRMEETRHYVSGACIWPRAEASSPTTGPSSPSRASLQFCFIASGSRKSRTSRSMQ
jgi:transposase